MLNDLKMLIDILSHTDTFLNLKNSGLILIFHIKKKKKH